MSNLQQIIGMIESLPAPEQREVFAHLRQKIPIHSMEATLKASAEVILDAISRSSALTIRGIEGIIAESAFAVEVVPGLKGLTPVVVHGDQPFDSLLRDTHGEVRVQVKMQRREKGLPLMANEIQKRRKWPADHYIVETQRTRTGKTKDGGDTRPYRFGSFDILAVSLNASKGRWNEFLYTLERWLLPSPKDESCIYTYQPVPPAPNEWWTDDFVTCVGWLRSARQTQIPG